MRASDRTNLPLDGELDRAPARRRLHPAALMGGRMFVSDGSLVTKTPVSISQRLVVLPVDAADGDPRVALGLRRDLLAGSSGSTWWSRSWRRRPRGCRCRSTSATTRTGRAPTTTRWRSCCGNPNPGMSGFDLWLWTSSTFDIYGDTFWLKQRASGGRVVGLYPLHPSSMTLTTTARGPSTTASCGSTTSPTRDLVRFRDFHPDSLTRGCRRWSRCARRWRTSGRHAPRRRRSGSAAPAPARPSRTRGTCREARGRTAQDAVRRRRRPAPARRARRSCSRRAWSRSR